MKPWQANIIGIGVAGAVLGGGLVLGAPEAVANGPSRVRNLGAPSQEGNTGELPLGDSVSVFGRPMRMSIFWTSDPADKVARTYMDAWTKTGMVPQQFTIDKVTQVSALDNSDGPGAGLQRSVTIIDNGQDRMVLPGLTDVKVLPDLTPRTAPVPIPSNALQYMGQVADDAGAVSYNGSFFTPMPASRVIDFYEAELGKAGYKAREPRKKVAGGMTIEFERGPEWISVVAKNDDNPTAKGAAPEAAAQVMINHVRTFEQRPEWKP